MQRSDAGLQCISYLLFSAKFSIQTDFYLQKASLDLIKHLYCFVVCFLLRCYSRAKNIFYNNQMINLPNINENLTEEENGTYACPPDVICPTYQQWYTIPVYQAGFTTQAGINGMPGVLVAEQGSSSIQQSHYGYGYFVTASLPTNWGSANGYLLYQKDNN